MSEIYNMRRPRCPNCSFTHMVVNEAYQVAECATCGVTLCLKHTLPFRELPGYSAGTTYRGCPECHKDLPPREKWKGWTNEAAANPETAASAQAREF